MKFTVPQMMAAIIKLQTTMMRRKRIHPVAVNVKHGFHLKSKLE